MKTEKLNYTLPTELIAQNPARRRTDARLLVYDRGRDNIIDSVFSEIVGCLRPGDCLVLNDTRVIPARFFAKRQTGARLEGLFLGQNGQQNWQIMLKGAGKVKTGEIISLHDTAENEYCQAQLLEKQNAGRCSLRVLTDETAEQVLAKIGLAPLPPYIKRKTAQDADSDRRRYQTVYARKYGAVAAPTAGLHFTDGLIEQLKEKGVIFAYVTLHVGAGTFKPVSEDELEKHQIHSEWFEISAEAANTINSAKKSGGRIIAVGTTSVRSLESAAIDGKVRPACDDTQLFITPGYEFKAVDAMITNFHLPKSTLLALVGAFAGLDNIKRAYQHAIDNRYRFYSYGDAMLIV